MFITLNTKKGETKQIMRVQCTLINQLYLCNLSTINFVPLNIIPTLIVYL